MGGRVISPAISHLQGAPSPTGFRHDNEYYLEIEEQIEISCWLLENIVVVENFIDT